jgi:hypothetical protein
VQTRLERGAGGSHVAPNEAASKEAIPIVNSIAAGVPAGHFENALGHPGGFEDAAAVISPTGGTSPSFTNLMIEHSKLGPMIASLHDCEAVVLFAGAKLSAGAQGFPANSETREACPSVISLTLESFSIASGFLLQDDPERGGGGQHSREVPVLNPESAQDDTGDVSVQEKEAAGTLEGKQNWVNEELQQDSVQDMDPSMGLSD